MNNDAGIVGTYYLNQNYTNLNLADDEVENFLYEVNPGFDGRLDAFADNLGMTATTGCLEMVCAAQVALLKSGVFEDESGNGFAEEGETITYSFTVTNTGNAILTDLNIDDATINVTDLVVVPSTLAPGEVGMATASYVVTQADIDAGGVYNLATVTGTDPNGDPVTDDSEDPNPLDPTDPNYDPTCPDCTFTELDPNPEVMLLKAGVFEDESGNGFAEAGETITYSFTVTNTGNVTLTDLNIDDATINVVDLVVVPSTLAPGEVGTATTSYPVTQADIDAGGVYNLATVTGTDPNGDPVTDESEDPNPLDPTDPNYDPTCPDCTFTELDPNPEVMLLKAGVFEDESGNGFAEEGETITYSFTVTNTGNVTLTNLNIDDATINVVDLVVVPSTLAPGEVGMATASYPVTQADIDAGGVYNLATVTGTDPDGDPVTDESEDPNPLDPTDPNYDPTCPDCTFTELDPNPEVMLLKAGVFEDESGNGFAEEGETITYSFTVTNTGNVTLTDLNIDDATINVTDLVVVPSTLAPGEVGTATASYVVTQADIDAGGVYNLATVTGTDPNGDPVTDESEDPNPLDPTDPNYDPTCPDCTFTELDPNPEVMLLKSGVFADESGNGFAEEGETITYSFTVTNTGNVTLTNLNIDDATINVTDLVVVPSTLAPGEVGTATASYVVTQADIDAGGVYNLATVTGTDPDGDPVTDESEDPNPLDPTDPNYDPTCPDCTFTELDPNPEVMLLKSGVFADESGNGFAEEGETITYSFTVTNTGNVTLTNLNIDDATINVVDLVVVPSTLAPGEVGMATASYPVTQADIDAGGVYNLATVTGTDPNGDPVTDDSEDPNPLDPTDPNYDPTCPDCTFTELDPNPEVMLLKSGVFTDESGNGFAEEGETITYSFTVTNTGNVTLTNLNIDDATINVVDLVVVPSTLAPGEVGLATASYPVTQADIDAGGVYNLATVTGTDPNGDPVTDDSEDPNPLDPTDPNYDPTCPDCTFTELDPNPEVMLLKAGVFEDESGNGFAEAGETITYSFTVTNTGNVTLTDLNIDDATINVTDLVVVPSTLAPGEMGTATASYVVTQADIDAGGVYNLATVTGMDPDDNPVTDESEDPNPLDPTDPNYDPTCPDCTFTELDPNPEVMLLKSGVFADESGNGFAEEGETITYSFTVTNTGNVILTDLNIDDATINVTDLVVVPSTLAPGEMGTATASYVVTQANIDAGGVYNLATVTGNDPDGDPVTDDSEDPNPLDPTDPNYDPTCPDCTFTELDPNPEVMLLKSGVFADESGNGFAEEGETITYSFTVTNTGNVTLTNLNIDDATINVTDLVVVPSTVAPGEVGTATASYVVTQADIDAGGVYNLATVTGNDPDGDPVTDESEDPNPLDPTDPNYDPTCPDCTFTELDPNPEVMLLKSGVFADESGNGFAEEGETITYSFTVTNTGNVTLTDLNIDDATINVTDLVVVPSTLAPGEVGLATASYPVTTTDINAGGVSNLATVTGMDPNDNPVTDDSEDPNPLDPTDPNYDPTCPDCTFTELDPSPEVMLLKAGVFEDESGDGFAQEGETITYSFTVTNTGNVTLTDLNIDDATINVTDLVVVPSTLAPGEVGMATASYVVTQADIDGGGVYNLATVTGNDPDGDPVTDDSEDPNPLDPTDPNYDPTCPDCTFTELNFEVAIELEKVGTFADENGDGFAQVGETITYSFTVTNTGAAPLTNVTINDPIVDVDGGPIAVLGIGESDNTTFTASYVLTQADINAGEVINQAIVTGTDPSGEDVSDESDDPNDFENVDPDNDGDPDDPTVVTVISPDVNVACISFLNVTLDADCQAVVIPEMVLSGSFQAIIDDLSISINGENTNIIGSCGNFTYMVTYTGDSDDVDFTTCWGTIFAEDKTPPAVVTEVEDVDLLCVDLDDNTLTTLPSAVSKCYEVFSATGATVPGTMAPQLRARLLAGGLTPLLPTFTDGCTDRIRVCVNDVVAYDAIDPLCEDVILTRTFTATEIAVCPTAAGEANASVTSSFRIIFNRPTLEDLDDSAIEPVVEFEQCGVANPTRANYPAPRPADFPALNIGDRIFNLTAGEAICNIGVTYADGEAIVTCPFTYKFIRTYTVIDWCNPGDVRTFTQVVKVGDTTPPVFTGPSQDRNFDGITDADLVYTTNAGNICAAYLRLDAAGVRAVDNCSGTNVTITANIYPGADLN
ncbi:hypothetical protein H9S92_00270, partial [Lewinella lacunae]|nr:hypothetical protein [Neolewinella lacunae]